MSWSAVRQLRDDPKALDLRTVPSAVAGDTETRHGIITAKSIPAKKYGVRTAETVGSALRKCPDLILVKADFKTYREYSRAFLSILRDYSDCVEQASIDEAYVDMTGSAAQSADIRSAAAALAVKIKNEIRDSLGFTVNIGISENKLLAKTASDFEKPDRIHTLWPEEVPDKLWPLPVGDLFGCGPATAAKLNTLGIRTIGEAAHTDEEVLKSLLGEKAGIYIHRASNGIGSDTVHGESGEAKGYSNELTTTEDIDRENYEKIGVPMVQELAEKVAGRLIRDHVYAQTIGVMVKTDSFRRRSRQITLSESTNSVQTICGTAQELMRDFLEGPGGLFEKGDKIRLLGVSAARIDHGEYRQMSLFDFDCNASDLQTSDAAVSVQKPRPAHQSGASAGEKISEIDGQIPEIDASDSDTHQNKASSTGNKGRTRRQHELDTMMEKIRSKYGDNAISKGFS